MEELTKKLLGKGPYPEDYQKKMVFFNSNDMCISTTITPLNFLPGSHVHHSYEFLIPLRPMPYTRVDKKVFSLDQGCLFPINKDQYHGPDQPMLNISLWAVLQDPQKLHNLAYLIAGKSEVKFSNQSVYLTDTLKYLLNSFIEEYKGKQIGYNFILETIGLQLLIEILKNTKNNLNIPNTKEIKRDNFLINKAIDFINSRQDFEYTLKDVANEVNFSPYHFIRLFKYHTGKTPYEYILDIKIQKAKRFLAEGQLTITEVCFMAGFTNHSHFTTIFKKKVGVSPSHYRKMSHL